MKSKTVLVTSLAAATLGLVSFVDTAGVLPFSVQTVQADSIIAVGNVDHKVKLSLVSYDGGRGVSVTFSLIVLIQTLLIIIIMIKILFL